MPRYARTFALLRPGVRDAGPPGGREHVERRLAKAADERRSAGVQGGEDDLDRAHERGVDGVVAAAAEVLGEGIADDELEPVRGRDRALRLVGDRPLRALARTVDGPREGDPPDASLREAGAVHLEAVTRLDGARREIRHLDERGRHLPFAAEEQTEQAEQEENRCPAQAIET